MQHPSIHTALVQPQTGPDPGATDRSGPALPAMKSFHSQTCLLIFKRTTTVVSTSHHHYSIATSTFTTTQGRNSKKT